MALQGLSGLGSSAARRSGGLSAYGRTPEEAEQSLLSKIGGGVLGGLATVGNVLDLPGSMIRDLIVGDNPFDQWLSPTSDRNRTTGREVLERTFGMRKNKETGFVPFADPGEFGRDVLGFGAEVLLDPTSYLTFGGAALTKTGKAAEKSGALKYLRELGRNKGIGVRQARTTLGAEDLLKATKNEKTYKELFDVAAEKMGTTGDDLLRQNEALGWTVGVGLPFGRPKTGFNLGPLGARYNRVADKVGDATRMAAPTRALRMLFDNSAGGKFSKVDQEIAERAYLDRAGALATAKHNQLEMAAEREPLLAEFRDMVQGKMDEGYDPNFDPRDITPFREAASARVKDDLARAQAERSADYTQNVVQEMKRDNPRIMDLLRKSPDKELDSIPGGDVFLEQFNRRIVGDRLFDADNPAYSADQLVDMLFDRPPGLPKQRVRDVAFEMRDEAVQQGKYAPDPERFTPGDIVIADDRGNFGRVQSIGERTSKVFFQNHQKGTSATVNLSNDKLRRAYKGNSEQGMAFATALTDKAFDDIVRGTREYGGNVDDILGSILPQNARMAVTDAMKEKIAKHASNMQEAQRAAYQALEDAGLPVTWLRREGDDFGVEHAERYVDAGVMERVAGEGQPLQTGFGSMLSRNQATRDLPTHVVNELHRSSRYRQRANETLQDAASRVLEDYGSKLNPQYGISDDNLRILDDVDRAGYTFGLDENDLNELARLGQQKTLAEGLGQDTSGLLSKMNRLTSKGQAAADAVRDGILQQSKQKHAEDIVGFLAGRKQNDLYTRRGLDDFFRYQKGAQLTLAGVNATYDVLGRKAQQAGGTIPVQEALRRAGFDVESGKALAAFQKRTGIDPATALIDEETVRSITSVMRPAVDPGWAEKLGQWVDKANRQFKTLVTIPFPSFAFRNHTSGQFQNLVASGEVNNLLDLNMYRGEYAASSRLFRNLNKGVDLTDDERKMLRELTAYEVIGKHGFDDIPLHGQPRPNVPEEMKIVPGAAFTPNSLKESFSRSHQKAVDTPWLTPKDSPRLAELKRKDVLTAAEQAELADLSRAASGSKGNKALNAVRGAAGGVVEQGGKVNYVVEWQNRVPMYSYLRKRGFSPEAAAKKVHELQFNYADLTDFEKRVMKRAAPFYSFTRFMVPQVIDTLRSRPGGGVAQTIRASRIGQEQDKPLPEQIASGAAIPWGTREDGTQSYLTGLGLAHEVPLQFLGGGIERAGRQGLSMLNPLIKAPMELATNRSFYFDRSLDDLDPVVGRLMTNLGLQNELPGGQAKPLLNSKVLETVASNSPLSRILTTARQAMDDRKTTGDKLLNAFTGARIHDISPGAQDAQIRDMLEDMMRKAGARTFSTTRFGKDVIGDVAKENLTEAERMAAFNEYLNLLSRRAKERKKAARSTLMGGHM